MHSCSQTHTHMLTNLLITLPANQPTPLFVCLHAHQPHPHACLPTYVPTYLYIYSLQYVIARSVFLGTRGMNDNGYMWLTEKKRTHVTFGVRSCIQAAIDLNPEFLGNISTGYTILIGDNNNVNTRIIKDGNRIKTAQTPGILDCNLIKYFWISWKDNYIEVGEGQVLGYKRLLWWRDNAPENERYDVKAVSVYGAGTVFVEARWEFHNIEGSPLYLLLLLNDIISHIL